jgi:hypothetical protein
LYQKAIGVTVIATIKFDNCIASCVCANQAQHTHASFSSRISKSDHLNTWYSVDGEVLKLQNGRLVSTAGFALDWRDVRYQNLPTWSEASADTQRVFVRTRDQMPKYRFGITEQIAIYPIAAPKDAKLAGISATQLHWVEEKVLAVPHGLASARFGLHTHAGVTQVIYGEQCLTKSMCIAWQKWPARL